MISKARPTDRINNLIQNGLGHDLNKLSYYRIVMQDPHMGFFNTVYREFAVEIMNNTLNYVLNDNVLYQRLRQLLLADQRKKQRRNEEIEVVHDINTTVKVIKKVVRET